jgi:hypothetical protein
VRRRAEAEAAEQGAGEVTPEIVERAIEEGRGVMQEAMRMGGHKLGMKEE